MDTAPRTLYRSAGQFLRVRGTERFVHYSRFFPHQLKSDTEIWELCGIRLVRQALADAEAQGAADVDIVGVDQTLSMLCGAVIRQVLDASPPGGPLVIGNCTIAMELEALKLLRRGRDELTPTPVDIVLARDAGEEIGTLVDFLHQDVDDAADRYPIRSIAAGPLRSDDVDPGAAMLFLNHARQCIADGPAALRMAVRHHLRTGTTVMVLLRTAEQAPLRGVTVDGAEVDVPSHYALLDTLVGEGVRGAHAFVEGFDRDFFIPPNDGCGMGIFVLSRDAVHAAVPGLQPFPGPSVSGRRELVSWSGRARYNYALALNWELPDAAGTAEWDWDSFKREHDDALPAETLAAHPSRAAGALLTSFVGSLSEERREANDATSAVRQLCAEGSLPWNGALMVARIANQSGESGLAWWGVVTALLDLGSYGLSTDAAFQRAEALFGGMLLSLRDPQAGMSVLGAFPQAAGDPFVAIQLAALRAVCALRCNLPDQLLRSACVLLRDPDWVPVAELMMSFARQRMTGGTTDLIETAADRTPSAREQAVLAVIKALRGPAQPT